MARAVGKGLSGPRKPIAPVAVVLAGCVAGALVAAACGFDSEAERTPPDAPEDTIVSPEASPIPRPDAGRRCPTANGAMVPVQLSGLDFCIDVIEVTNSAYDVFLGATTGSPNAIDAAVPEGCSGNTTFARVGGGPDEVTTPVANVDWCDAYAYCLWAGKRLCGKTIERDASTGEWFAACSNGGRQAFAYGATYEAGACNDTGGTTTPVTSSPACQGGVAGLFDMNGNVAELIDSCGGGGCNAVGGSYSFGSSTGCAAAVEVGKSATDPTWGFRCCADVR